jgi:hypothetical protein
VAEQAILRRANRLRIAQEFPGPLDNPLGIFRQFGVGLEALQGAALKIVRFIFGVSRAQRWGLELHSSPCCVLLGDFPGDYDGDLLEVFEIVIGNERVDVLRKLTARGGCHPGNLADLVSKGLLCLSIHTSIGDPIACGRGDEQNERNPEDHLLSQAEFVERESIPPRHDLCHCRARCRLDRLHLTRPKPNRNAEMNLFFAFLYVLFRPIGQLGRNFSTDNV